MLAMRCHLTDCPDCRAEEESLRALKRLLSSTTVPEPSPDLADRLCASVLANHRPKPAEPNASLRASVLTFVGVAACSMALTYTLYTRVSASSSASAPSPGVVSASTGQDLGFDIQRDEVYATGLDATSGVPVLLTPQNGR
jgi:anti-sigma factor RsiW